MSPWHLLWIVPAAQFFGFMLAAVLAAGHESDRVEHLDAELARVKTERDSLLMQYEWTGQ